MYGGCNGDGEIGGGDVGGVGGGEEGGWSGGPGSSGAAGGAGGVVGGPGGKSAYESQDASRPCHVSQLSVRHASMVQPGVPVVSQDEPTPPSLQAASGVTSHEVGSASYASHERSDEPSQLVSQLWSQPQSQTMELPLMLQQLMHDSLQDQSQELSVSQETEALSHDSCCTGS